MGLAWDGDAGLVVIEAQAPVEDAEVAEETLLEDVEDGPDALRVRIEPGAPRGVRRPGPPRRRRRAARRARCAGCRSIATGHVCPRQNGYHRPTLRIVDLATNPPTSRPHASFRSTTHWTCCEHGELDIEGRLIDASNATLYCAVCLDGVDGRLRLQAGRRGAAAVGLPGRHTGRARGRGLRGVSRHRLAHRAADGATVTDRSARAWCSCGSTPTTTSTFDGSSAAPSSVAAAAHRRVRRGDQQRRPQGRPPAADPIRPRVRRRPRRELPRRAQAAHRAVAVGRGVAWLTTRSTCWASCGLSWPDGLGERLNEPADPAGGATHGPAGRPAAGQPVGIPSRAATGRRCPGRRSETNRVHGRTLS